MAGSEGKNGIDFGTTDYARNLGSDDRKERAKES